MSLPFSSSSTYSEPSCLPYPSVSTISLYLIIDGHPRVSPHIVLLLLLNSLISASHFPSPISRFVTLIPVPFLFPLLNQNHCYKHGGCTIRWYSVRRRSSSHAHTPTLLRAHPIIINVYCSHPRVTLRFYPVLILCVSGLLVSNQNSSKARRSTFCLTLTDCGPSVAPHRRNFPPSMHGTPKIASLLLLSVFGSRAPIAPSHIRVGKLEQFLHLNHYAHALELVVSSSAMSLNEALTASRNNSIDLARTQSEAQLPSPLPLPPSPVEMDAIPTSTHTHTRTLSRQQSIDVGFAMSESTNSSSRSRSRPRPKSKDDSPMRPVLNRREYAVGILLLLVVVFLWTSSNFVTQVSKFFG